jgi:hypothetical protein
MCVAGLVGSGYDAAIFYGSVLITDGHYVRNDGDSDPLEPFSCLQWLK